MAHNLVDLLEEVRKQKGESQSTFVKRFSDKPTVYSRFKNWKQKLPMKWIPTAAELLGLAEKEILKLRDAKKSDLKNDGLDDFGAGAMSTSSLGYPGMIALETVEQAVRELLGTDQPVWLNRKVNQETSSGSMARIRVTSTGVCTPDGSSAYGIIAELHLCVRQDYAGNPEYWHVYNASLNYSERPPVDETMLNIRQQLLYDPEWKINSSWHRIQN